MRFNYVSFKNFLSYGEGLNTVKLDDGGVTLVNGENKRDGGSNGSGKSAAVVDSIVYALFGQTTKKLKADQIVNNRMKSNCYVELSFSMNNEDYLIRRYRLHSELGNTLVFEKNGTDISGEGIRETQASIESIIKMSFKSFVLSIILSQEKISNFAESDPLERRKIIENLLMYDFISKYHKATKEILRVLNPEIQKTIDHIDEREETIGALSDGLMQYIDKWEDELKKKRDRIADLEEHLEELNKVDVPSEQKHRAEVKVINSEVSNLSDELRPYEQIESQGKRQISVLRNRLNEKHKEIEELNENPEECPVCGSKVKDGVLDEYLQAKVDRLESIKEEIQEQQKIFDDKKKSKGLLEDQLRSKKEERDTLKRKINSELTDDDLQHITEKISHAKSEIKILESQLDVKIEDDSYIIEAQSKVDQIKDKRKKLRRKLKRLEEEAEYYNWWKSALSSSPNSIKTFCVNHVLQSLNKYIAYYLEFFKFDVSYELDNELNDVIVKDDEETTFAQLSAGEKRAIELSLVFALHEIIRLKMPDEINIIVLDELLSTNLDEVRISAGVDILSELATRDLSVFVIDHKNYLKDNLECKTINVIKAKDGTSFIETSTITPR